LPIPVDLTQIAIRHGRDKKRNNAIVAVLCGALPAIALGAHFFPVTWKTALVGLIVGLLWGNAFEYVYHRWLLHGSGSSHGAGHREHHAHIGTPEQAEHVALVSSPLNVVLLFVINSVPAILIIFLIGRRGILSGLFIGWALYLIVTEEVHWRIHMNQWLPPGLRSARAYHMSHHARPNCRYNVFLPVFDFFFGNTKQAAR
jgi:hypothetical protein